MLTAERMRITVTAPEATGFAARLEQWAAGLPPREQALLGQLLFQAAVAPPDDVQGFLVDAAPDPARSCQEPASASAPLTVTFFPAFGGGIRVPIY